jgi:intracellular septation protein
MTLLLDFLPILFFFGTFKYAEAHRDWATGFATEHFGSIVSGGVVGAIEAPVLLATVVVIVATLAQISFLLSRGKRIDTMLWVSLVLVVGLGGATAWFHSEDFIKWKPTVLHWGMALGLWGSAALFGNNLPRKMLGEQLSLPDPLWAKVNWAWVAFFVMMGVLNRYVATQHSTNTWVNFKLFGSMGLIFAFMLAQGLYLSRYAAPEEADAQPPAR